MAPTQKCYPCTIHKTWILNIFKVYLYIYKPNFIIIYTLCFSTFLPKPKCLYEPYFYMYLLTLWEGLSFSYVFKFEAKIFKVYGRKSFIKCVCSIPPKLIPRLMPGFIASLFFGGGNWEGDEEWKCLYQICHYIWKYAEIFQSVQMWRNITRKWLSVLIHM